MQRYDLPDAQWEQIKNIPLCREGHIAGAVSDIRPFVETGLDVGACRHHSYLGDTSPLAFKASVT